MPDADGKLTVEDLKNRWKTPEGKKFKLDILGQLQRGNTGNKVDWENLSINIDEKTVCWEEFPGVREIYEQPKLSCSEIEYDRSNEQYGDLRGISFKEERERKGSKFNLHGANLNSTHLESSDLSNIKLTNCNLDHANIRNAVLRETYIINSKIRKAHFENADLWFACFYYSDLYGTDFEGANLYGTNFEEAYINEANFQLKSWWWRVGISRIIFNKIDKGNHKKIISFLKFVFKKMEKLKRDIEVLEPTILEGAELKNVRLDSDPILYRDLLDEQYLDKFAEKHKILYPFWLLTSNCGRTVFLLLVWTIFFGIICSLVFSDFSCPSWFPDIIETIDPHFTYNGLPQSTWWQPFYMSFVTMTTLGLASAEPINDAAFWWHTIQNIFGYIWLGYLIAVLGSKLTRRSA